MFTDEVTDRVTVHFMFWSAKIIVFWLSVHYWHVTRASLPMQSNLCKLCSKNISPSRTSMSAIQVECTDGTSASQTLFRKLLKKWQKKRNSRWRVEHTRCVEQYRIRWRTSNTKRSLLLPFFYSSRHGAHCQLKLLIVAQHQQWNLFS